MVEKWLRNGQEMVGKMVERMVEKWSRNGRGMVERTSGNGRKKIEQIEHLLYNKASGENQG